MQIAPPPKKDTVRYQKLRNKVHKLVGRINGRFGTLEHSPIHYLDRAISFCELCALYLMADVALITSLREGMSKVAFEFIACQEIAQGDGFAAAASTSEKAGTAPAASPRLGVLILSEFVGATQTLGSGALLVNPFNSDEVAKAISDALAMEAKEVEENHNNLSEYVSKFTLQYWADDFVTELLTQEGPDQDIPQLSMPKELPKPAVCEAYRPAGKRLIVLGLLGTLIDYTAFTGWSPSPMRCGRTCSPSRRTRGTPSSSCRAASARSSRSVWATCRCGSPLRMGCTTASAGAPSSGRALWRTSTTRGSRASSRSSSISRTGRRGR